MDLCQLPMNVKNYLTELPTQMVIGGHALLASTLQIINYDPYNKFLYMTSPVIIARDPTIPKLKSQHGSRVNYEFNDDCDIIYIRIDFTTEKPTYSKYDPMCKVGHIDHNDPEQFFYADADRYVPR